MSKSHTTKAKTDASSNSQLSRVKLSTYKGPKDSDSNTIILEQDDFLKSILKPPDQLQLTDQELKEEFTKILTAENPRASKNVVRYNFKFSSKCIICKSSSNFEEDERCFQTVPATDQLAIHFSVDGNKIHEKSEEAKKQLQREAKSSNSSNVTSQMTVTSPAVDQEDKLLQDDEEAVKTDQIDPDTENQELAVEGQRKSASVNRGVKKLTNQFNFSERATQSYNNPPRAKHTMTEPPPTMSFSANVTQWQIFDTYQMDYEKNVKMKDKKSISKQQESEKKKTNAEYPNAVQSMKALKIVERMINQNIFDEVTHDFKYYEDASDDFKDYQGSLLPLWTFKFKNVSKLTVTSICWNPVFSDLFAAGYGSYEYEKKVDGKILLFTLKNPSYPEYIFNLECSVTSVDFHPQHPYLLLAGLQDGNVAVFDIVTNNCSPVFKSNCKTGKHLDIINQVKWQVDDSETHLSFFSVSSDGDIFQWTILKNELTCRSICTLSIGHKNILEKGVSIVPIELTGSGTSFDFHPKNDELYLVGTEEGKIHICSKNQKNRYLTTYDAHFGPVYKVLWSPYCPTLFLSCSEDWLIKIWDRSVEKNPLFVFDLGCAVEDVEWAPYSSTVFAAVTQDGKAHVFDINIKKSESLCEQRVVGKKGSKLTRLAFNGKHPILLVGDDRGTIHSLKLSPNLRRMPKEKKGQDLLKPDEKEVLRNAAEVDKLEKLLIIVRPFVNKITAE